MRETLNVRWKPDTVGVSLVTSANGTLEWNIEIFKMIFGRFAYSVLSLQGTVQVTREALPMKAAATRSSAA